MINKLNNYNFLKKNTCLNKHNINEKKKHNTLMQHKFYGKFGVYVTFSFKIELKMVLVKYF